MSRWGYSNDVKKSGNTDSNTSLKRFPPCCSSTWDLNMAKCFLFTTTGKYDMHRMSSGLFSARKVPWTHEGLIFGCGPIWIEAHRQMSWCCITQELPNYWSPILVRWAYRRRKKYLIYRRTLGREYHYHRRRWTRFGYSCPPRTSSIISNA